MKSLREEVRFLQNDSDTDDEENARIDKAALKRIRNLEKVRDELEKKLEEAIQEKIGDVKDIINKVETETDGSLEAARTSTFTRMMYSMVDSTRRLMALDIESKLKFLHVKVEEVVSD